MVFLWLWCRPAAVAPLHPLAWELSYAAGASWEKNKEKKSLFLHEDGKAGGEVSSDAQAFFPATWFSLHHLELQPLPDSVFGPEAARWCWGQDTGVGWRNSQSCLFIPLPGTQWSPCWTSYLSGNLC